MKPIRNLWIALAAVFAASAASAASLSFDIGRCAYLRGDAVVAWLLNDLGAQ